MNEVDKIINKSIGLPYEENGVTKISITLKGKATTDPFEISELNRGWKDGFEHAIFNWTESGEFKVFPEGCNIGIYGNGFSEGVKSGINRHLDRLYPGAKSLSYNRVTKKYDVTY